MAAIVCVMAPAVSLYPSTFAWGDIYNQGDLIVTDSHDANFHGEIIDVNPKTGAQRVIASGGNLEQPNGVCLDAAGNIIVTDYGGQTVWDYGSIIRIDRITGKQSVVSSGGLLSHPNGVALDAEGQLIVGANAPDQSYGMVLKIDPTTGAQTLLGGPAILFGAVTGVALDRDSKSYFVSDFQAGATLLKIDAASDTSTVITTSNTFVANMTGVWVDRGNDEKLLATAVYIDGSSAPTLLSLDLNSGQRSAISIGGELLQPDGVTQDWAGDIFVTDAGPMNAPRGAILQIDPATGAQTVISSGGDLLTPEGIMFVPEPGAWSMLICAVLVLCGVRQRHPSVSRGLRPIKARV